MRKILLLGGLRYLIPVIKTIKKMGHYAITCDYLPENIAHKHSDEYYNIDITDREAVKELAYSLKVDGILSFAVDPGVISAAYATEALGLPSIGPLKSVEILQNKALFRNFLNENGFNVPKAKGYCNITEALSDLEQFNWPVIVKPTDSAGSKGVTKVDEVNGIEKAILYAMKFSKSNEFIIEEFIESNGIISDCDSFSVNGVLDIFTLSNQKFNTEAINPFTPSGFTWPPKMDSLMQNELRSELQRLLSLLGMKTSIYNIETRIGIDNKPYIMEVSPRGGGNRLSEMVKLCTNTDLIEMTIHACIGEVLIPTNKKLQYTGYWGELILHSNKEGYFNEVKIDSSVMNYIYEIDIWVEKGDRVNRFSGAHDTLGTLILRCDDEIQLNTMMENRQWIEILVN